MLPWYCLKCQAHLTETAAQTHACCPAQRQAGPTGIVRTPNDAALVQPEAG